MKATAMRTLQQSSKLILGASLAILAAVQFAAGAGFPFTAPGPGVQWYISDNMLPNPGTSPPNGGLALSDADFNNATQGVDAYDGAFAIKVNGAYFAAPATASLNGNLFDSTAMPSTSGPFNVQAKFTFFQNLPIVRATYSFTATAATTVTVNWDVNLGSDDGTKIRGTSSGANANTLALADRWFVSSDSRTLPTPQGQPPPDLINTIVRWGPGAPQSPEAGSALLTTPKDLLSDKYTLTFTGAGSQSLMMFAVLTPLADSVDASATSAKTFAALFDDPQAMRAQGYFDGIDAQNIRNWGVVPEPGLLSLLGVGLGIFIFRARQRS